MKKSEIKESLIFTLITSLGYGTAMFFMKDGNLEFNDYCCFGIYIITVFLTKLSIIKRNRDDNE